MRKIVLLSISLLSLQLSAQDIQLTILQKSVKVKNDSLYFRYRIQNNSDTVFAFYNVRSIDFVWFHEEEYHEYLAPRFVALIYDKNDVFLLQKWQSMPPFNPIEPIKRTYEDSIHSLSYGKYIVLNPGQAVEYDRRLYIENFELEKSTYKFQLRYFSSDYYKQRYINAKKKDIRLKNSLMFEGEVRSNFCFFEYPYVKRDD